MTSNLPNVGPGALTSREDQKLVGTDKERTLYAPQDVFYKKMGIDCSNFGIGVDLFLPTVGHIDVATLGMNSRFYLRLSAVWLP